MPTGPKGQKRPADVVGAAVLVAKIATGEASEDHGSERPMIDLGTMDEHEQRKLQQKLKRQSKKRSPKEGLAGHPKRS